MGINGFKGVINYQQVDSYYDLFLNEETSRYVFRAVAIKEVMEHPAQYGFHYDKEQLYQYIPTIKIKVDSSIANLAEWSKKQGINYKILKELNPWLRKHYLTVANGKSYFIDLPKNPKIALFTFPDEKEIHVNVPEFTQPSLPILTTTTTEIVKKDSVILKPATIYTVRKGDDLEKLARKFGVKPIQIMTWNKMDGIELKKGQELIIYQDPIEKR
jgi:LysM repeat protein